MIGVVPTQAGVVPACDAATETFVAHRNLLFTVAYQILGSVADAEDVVQASWLKWVAVDLQDVRNRRAYLVQIAARQALGRLRTLRRRRESYIGLWLPEPLCTAQEVAEDSDLTESLSFSMLLVLETLTPTERVVFLLREVFDMDYDTIAKAVDKSPVAVRQIAHRARSSIAARRSRNVVSSTETAGAVSALQRAIETGNLQALLDTLAPDVALLSDGGGVVQAAMTPIVGAPAVADALTRIGPSASLSPAWINAHPGLVIRRGSIIDTVIAVRLEDGKIVALYVIRNPSKLSQAGREMVLQR